MTGPELTMEGAVALALHQQRSIIAARLEVDAAHVEATAARLWPNPELAYSLNNLVLGPGNDQERNLRPSFAEQTIQSFGLEQSFDIWRRRWARLQSAYALREVAQCQLQDVLREVIFQTRRAYLNAVREQHECALAETNAAHWSDSAALMARRLESGDVSHADVAKVELEALRARNALIAGQGELARARAELAAVMGLAPEHIFDAQLFFPKRSHALHETGSDAARTAALDGRPDVRAAAKQVDWARSNVIQQKREALPDIALGVAYGRSQFMISGDNPHTLGVSLVTALPVFNRNQVGRSQAAIALERANNALEMTRITAHKELLQAQSALKRAISGLDIFEAQGMLQRADNAKNMAHRALKNGAFTLIDVLEAERTALEVQAEYLVIKDALFQAQIELAYVTAQELL